MASLSSTARILLPVPKLEAAPIPSHLTRPFWGVDSDMVYLFPRLHGQGEACPAESFSKVAKREVMRFALFRNNGGGGAQQITIACIQYFRGVDDHRNSSGALVRFQAVQDFKSRSREKRSPEPQAR